MDTTYLIKRRQTWYAYITVPPSLQDIIGKQKLQRSLKTRDLATANRLKLAVVSEFKNYIDAVKKHVSSDTPLAEVTLAARYLAESIKIGTTSRDNADSIWSVLLDNYLEKNHSRDKDTGEFRSGPICLNSKSGI